MTNDRSRQPKIFVSHSSRDVGLAQALVNLLRSALTIASTDIRCTSVDGYRLPVGMSVSEKLKTEVHDAEVLIALITRNSLSSSYFLFELGARWGAGRPLYPIYAGGATIRDVNAWLGDFHGVNAGALGEIMQLVGDVATALSVPSQTPESYLHHVNVLIAASNEAEVDARQLYGLPDPAEREREQARMKTEEGSAQAAKDYALFWETLRKYYLEVYKPKDSPDFPETIEAFVEPAGAPPQTIDVELYAWPKLYERRLTFHQHRLWDFAQKIYPSRQADQSGEVWQYSAIKPEATAEAFHWARRNLSKFWDTWPPLAGYTFIEDRFTTKRYIILLLAWLELALVQWTQMPGRHKQQLFKLAAHLTRSNKET